MDAAASGLLVYAAAVLSMAGIYAILSLGLNVQWGYSGLFNLGIAGFFAVGAYTSAILTAAPSPTHVGGLALPVPVGMVLAALVAGLVAWPIGKLTLRLKADYLAIATIGIAEILRLVLKNEAWLTNGAFGISRIPRPFETIPRPFDEIAFLALIAGIVLVLYWGLERCRRAPWGRVLRAIRDDETAAEAIGRDTAHYKLVAFVLGSMIMGLGGAVYAHYIKFLSPEAFEPLMSTFIVWVMLVAGGSGNNRGAILGAVAVWAIWSATELITSQLPTEWTTRAAYIRVFMIGLILQFVLQLAPRGLLAERPPRPLGTDKPSPTAAANLAAGPQPRTPPREAGEA